MLKVRTLQGFFGSEYQITKFGLPFGLGCHRSDLA